MIPVTIPRVLPRRLALYERRADKQYSLTDCIPMNVMRQKRIREILTHDRHFAQEGFVRLLARRV